MLADRSHTYLVPGVEIVDMVAEQGFAVPRFFVGWIAKISAYWSKYQMINC